MEIPVTLTPEHVRDEKVKVLQAVHDANVVLGQHEGYKDNPTFANDFSTCLIPDMYALNDPTLFMPFCDFTAFLAQL
ncbi:unnamed protein product [Sphagnum jensenii]|uniref:Uncharacterized protein n=1 Tax=Sphagnum jensenii TaxID=128206 RepID=A0ABP0WF57_9BRYO